MKQAQGFTLIELMIVVAIIAILAAIALPAYQDYVARAHVTEGYSLASDARTAVSAYFAEHTRYPNGNIDAAIASPGSITGRYVESVTVGPANGDITIAFGKMSSQKIWGKSLLMHLSNNGGSLQWNCSGMDARYVPAVCR